MQTNFTGFEPTSASQWKAQLTKDLKGESYDSLIWHNENGFDIAPFYTAEDVQQDREALFSHTDWAICVKANETDEKKNNAHLLRLLNSGAGSVSLSINKGSDIETLLNQIQLNHISSVFFTDPHGVVELLAYLKKSYNPAELSVSLIAKVNSPQELKSWYHNMDSIRQYGTIKTTGVDVLPYHNLNCHAYYEVALIFSQLVEHLEVLSKEKSVNISAPVIKTGVNTDYFIQIAKLRAIRRIWNLLKKEYNIDSDLYLIVETGLTNISVSDNYNNLLRTTVEAMAAVSGGCNELIVNEFDVLFPVNPALSERMSVNQQLILKHESYFDKIADVACGSFFIESITDAIASKALEAFKQFEKQGGYFECLRQDIFQKEIELQAQSKDEQFRSLKQIAIGVNKFRNEKEQLSVSQQQLDRLLKLNIHNPALAFEIENYFKKQ